MKKNEIFTFTVIGTEVTGIVVGKVSYDVYLRTATTKWLCYAQNRLFLCSEEEDIYTEKVTIKYSTDILVDYAVLPDYDRMLEDYQHQIDIANDYASKEL